jgi:hypothetical protein
MRMEKHMNDKVKRAFEMVAAFEPIRDTWRQAVELADENGIVCAGHNVTRKGSLIRVNARTLDALIRRGVLEHCYSSDGGYAARMLRPVDAYVDPVNDPLRKCACDKYDKDPHSGICDECKLSRLG